MKTLYYDLTGRHWVDPDSYKPISRSQLPTMGYQQEQEFEIHLGRVDPYYAFTATDLSDIVSLSAALATDFDAATAPLARTNSSANYDLTQKATGIIKVTMDSDTTEFLDAVNGEDSVNGYFEIRLFNASGKVPYLIRPAGTSIILQGLVDPGTGDPGTIPTNYYTKAESDSAFLPRSTMDPTNVAGDAYDMDNMADGSTKVAMTILERSKLDRTTKAAASMIPTGTTQDIDWSAGALQTLDLGSATGNVTLTFSNAMSGERYALRIIQGATARNVILPASVKIPGGSDPNTLTITATDDAVDLLDLTVYTSEILANFTQNYC